MKTKKVSMLVIFFSILIFISLSAFATNSSEKQASDFQSNGDLIKGWYWLRDSALHNYAEWTFDNIPLGPEEITVQINALATDRPSGGRGFDAKFLLYYSFRGEGPIPTMLIPPQTVTLDNVSSPDDPLGYKCQGQVTIPASTLPAASRVSLKVRRDSAQDNHVAFKEDSIVLLTDAIYPPNVDPSSNDDDFEGAVPVRSGTYTGSLGEEDEEGHRDNRDYYSIDLEDGQLISLQLTVPGNANYGISLLNPKQSPRGSSITQREIKTLDYVADSTGTWYIRVSRSSGEGEYQLAIDIQDQNDADSGQDAGDSYQGAIPISPDTFTGLLKAGDNRDYYSINIEEGQQITLQLTVPGNANYGISLLNPKQSPRGSSITQREIKTLDYVADSTGTWYIRVSRSSGEGEYQLAIDIQDQNDADSGQDAGDSYQGAIPISPDTFTGLLKAGDNRDYYSIEVEEGQLISLQLTVPGNANYGISLLDPNHHSRGSSITQREIKTLDYVADSTGTWYIRVSRSSGEGEYQLAVNSSGVSGNHPPVISSLAADQDSIEINHNVEITCNASDQDGDTLRFGWTANGVDVGGNNSSLNWRAPATAGTYIITCTVNDSKGGQDRESVSITVTSNSGVSDNYSPVISSLDANQDSIEINHYVGIYCSANDQDGDTLTFNWTVNGEIEIAEGHPSSLSWRAPDTAGTYTITCTVSDSKGGEDSESVSITVTEAINHSPVISSVNPAYDSLEINRYVPITCNASDQDGDTLIFSWTANGVSVGENDSFLTWRAPATAGTYTITCTVSDSKGGEDSESVSITVTSNGGGAGSSCSYSFSSCDSHFSSSGGSEEFTVTPSNSDCQWTAVSDVSWIQIDSGGTGPGSQALCFSVQNNSSNEERTGHISIENETYTITQESEIIPTIPYPQPNGESIPFPTNCRGACGEGCPDTCVSLPPITIRVADPLNDMSHYLLTYTGVTKCGTHAGCRWHDACFDQCKLCEGDSVVGPLHDLCSAEVVDKYGPVDGGSWLLGHGPYDRYFIFSDPPVQVEGGPFPGSVHSFTEANYRIDVNTGFCMGAGTDANVYIMLFGTDGSSSAEVLLDNSGMNDFEMTMRDTFYVRLKNFEDINQIRLWHDNSFSISGDISLNDLIPGNIFLNDFLPGSITINDLIPGNITINDLIPGNITLNDITSGNISIDDLTPGSFSIDDLIPGNITLDDLVPGSFSIDDFLPGSIPFISGFFSDILSLADLDLSSFSLDDITPGSISLDDLVPGSFSIDDLIPGSITINDLIPGSISLDDLVPGSFSIDDLIPGNITLNDITPGSFSIDDIIPGDFLAGWYVDEVRIINQDTGQLWHFITNRWLAEDEGDGQIDVRFPLSHKDERDYQIDVYTGIGEIDDNIFNMFNMQLDREGTDANIYITLFGRNGFNTGEISLNYPYQNNFETGYHDTFYYIRTANIGELDGITLRSDNSGAFSDWYCEKIEVKEIKLTAWDEWLIPLWPSSATFPPEGDYYAGRKWIIPVDAWLTEDNPTRTRSPQ